MLNESKRGVEPRVVSAITTPSLEQRFAGYQRLTVRQQKRWLEILTSFEVKNTYDVFDETGSAKLRVREQGSGFWSLLKRIFLGPARPFRVHVSDTQTGQVLLELQRPFRFLFHRLDVRSIDGRVLGAIQKKWSVLRRIYHIEAESGQKVAELFGPIFRPWTFEIRVQGREVGLIQKKWSGLGKELFTDADNFGVQLAQIQDARLKLLVFAAIVLIDVVHFEKSKR
ncbi:MAG: Phospholipid scramblase 1 [Myxococcaceae bacterium]|nr:Phospholipid scramblase 1 [Myxococcaceae bacterium]